MLLCVGPGADPVSSQPRGDVMIYWVASCRYFLQLTSQPHSITLRPLSSTKLYCLVIEAHVCEQLAESSYMKAQWPGVEPCHCYLQTNNILVMFSKTNYTAWWRRHTCVNTEQLAGSRYIKVHWPELNRAIVTYKQITLFNWCKQIEWRLLSYKAELQAYKVN